MLFHLLEDKWDITKTSVIWRYDVEGDGAPTNPTQCSLYKRRRSSASVGSVPVHPLDVGDTNFRVLRAVLKIVLNFFFFQCCFLSHLLCLLCPVRHFLPVTLLLSNFLPTYDSKMTFLLHFHHLIILHCIFNFKKKMETLLELLSNCEHSDIYLTTAVRRSRC